MDFTDVIKQVGIVLAIVGLVVGFLGKTIIEYVLTQRLKLFEQAIANEREVNEDQRQALREQNQREQVAQQAAAEQQLEMLRNHWKAENDKILSTMGGEQQAALAKLRSELEEAADIKRANLQAELDATSAGRETEAAIKEQGLRHDHEQAMHRLQAEQNRLRERFESELARMQGEHLVPRHRSSDRFTPRP